MTHLLSIDDLGRDDIGRLLDAAGASTSGAGSAGSPLAGHAVVTAFDAGATAVRLSFETAARRLGAHVTTVALDAHPGETPRRSIEGVSAFGADVVVVRHRSAGVAALATRWTGASVVNGGDGSHQDPTQALLDAYVVSARLGSLDGLRVGLVGDVARSAIARSDVAAFTALGASVVLVAPPTLLPVSLAGWPVTVSHDLDAVIGTLDVCRLLPVGESLVEASLVPSLRDYSVRFGLTPERAGRLRRGALVVRPEADAAIAPGVDDLADVVVPDQSTDGVAVRQAVLASVAGHPPVGPHEASQP